MIAESVPDSPEDLQQLLEGMNTTLDKLNEMQNNQEKSIQSVENSFYDIQQGIRDFRQTINSALDQMESATCTQMATHRFSLTGNIKTNAEYFARHKGELKQLSESLQELVNKNKKELTFIASRKCHDKMKWSEENLGKTAHHQKFPNVLIFQANADILQYLSKQLILGTILYGNPDKVMTIIKKTKYSLGKLPTLDRDDLTNIIDICGLPNDKIIVAHKGTKTLTLLDQHYKIVSQCCAYSYPKSICQISSTLLAIASNEDTNRQQCTVQFINVIDNELDLGTMFWLDHTCTSIAHHQDSLFITSGTALNQYSMIGKLVKRLYKDPSGLRTVHKCVVGPNCGRLYITNLDQNKLLTLNADGALLSTFTDPQITDAFTVYVTPLGQVLVCDGSSKTIIQVDGEGKSKLATLATGQDGVSGPMSLCYNTNTDSLIVALWYNNTMLVFDVLPETFPRKFRYPKF